MPVEHARVLFKLSETLLQISYKDEDDVGRMRKEAEGYLLRRDPKAVEFDREASYDMWVPIFWR